jgi:2-(1,2-epoxy-1,2-dihydrophenyl)acetyl-CoA isomerase
MAGSTAPENTPAARIAADLYQALADGDRARLAELLHPGFEGRVTDGLPLGLGGVYRGPDAMCRHFWGRIARSYVARVVPSEFCLLPDGRLMVTGRYAGAARSGGVLDAEFVHFLTFTDGQISGLVQLTDSARWASALAAGPATAARREPGPDARSERGSDDRPAGGLGLRAESGSPGQAAREPATVEFSAAGGLGIIRLNRPAARNAINEAFAADFAEAVRRCAADASVRALLICGTGSSFTVGGDVAMLAGTEPGELPEKLRRLTTSYHAALQVLDSLPVPVVAAVHGAVAGGGLGLIYVADVVIAAAGTKFAAGFGGLGLSGDGSGTWFLPRLVGARRAAEFYLEQRVLTADEAAGWGLITRVVPAAELTAEAERTACQLAAGPTRAWSELRTLLRRSDEMSLSEQLAAETAAQCRTAGTRDARHAIASFMAKTRPAFDGH